MSAGLDRCDLLSVSGWGRVERGKPHGGFTLGRDFCGVVLEAGRGVEHLAPGDKVWGATSYHDPGTLSEQVSDSEIRSWGCGFHILNIKTPHDVCRLWSLVSV